MDNKTQNTAINLFNLHLCCKPAPFAHTLHSNSVCKGDFTTDDKPCCTLHLHFFTCCTFLRCLVEIKEEGHFLSEFSSFILSLCAGPSMSFTGGAALVLLFFFFTKEPVKNFTQNQKHSEPNMFFFFIVLQLMKQQLSQMHKNCLLIEKLCTGVSHRCYRDSYPHK